MSPAEGSGGLALDRNLSGLNAAMKFYWDLQDLLELTQKKRCWFFFMIGDWNAKAGSQEIPGVTDKFGLGVQNEGQRLTEFCQENALVIANTLFQHHEMTLHMDITRWSIPK